MRRNPVATAARRLGGIASMARIAGVSKQAAHQWVQRGWVSPEGAPLIEAALRQRDCTILAEKLCPAVAWGIIRANPVVSPEVGVV